MATLSAKAFSSLRRLHHTPRFCHIARLVCSGLAAASCVTAVAQQGAPPQQIPAVTITAKANPDPVEKSYRKMLRGMDLFERQHALAPQATLRFKLLPRKPQTDMNSITLAVLGDTVDVVVPIASDHTFTLPRNALAVQENALVIPNRRALSMTWRTDIRSPDLPPNARRLGDLRLECRVGMEAGLVSNSRSVLGRLFSALLDTPAYCDQMQPLYMFFSDRPLFSVSMVAGARREVLPIQNLFAAASDDRKLQNSLPFCDCEVLLDRTYTLPLGDSSWPDDTLVEFDYMDDAMGLQQVNEAISVGKTTKSEVLAALGQATEINFDSGYAIWVYRDKLADSQSSLAELVVLFDPTGTAKGTRLRPQYVKSAP